MRIAVATMDLCGQLRNVNHDIAVDGLLQNLVRTITEREQCHRIIRRLKMRMVNFQQAKDAWFLNGLFLFFWEYLKRPLLELKALKYDG